MMTVWLINSGESNDVWTGFPSRLRSWMICITCKSACRRESTADIADDVAALKNMILDELERIGEGIENLRSQ